MTTPRDKIDPIALLRYLHIHGYGLLNAKSGRKIADHFHVGDTKRVREAVNDLRRGSKLVGSVKAGYFIPANRREALIAKKFITTLFQPLREAVDGYDRAVECAFGPDSLFDNQEVDDAIGF